MAIEWLQPAITGAVAVVGVAGTWAAARQARNAQIHVAELTKEAQLQVAAVTRQTQVDIAALSKQSQLEIARLSELRALTDDKRPLYASYLRILNEAADCAQTYRKASDLLADETFAVGDDDQVSLREQTRKRATASHTQAEQALAKLTDLQFQIMVTGGPDLGIAAHGGTTAVSLHAVGRITESALRETILALAIAMHADINPAVVNKQEAIKNSISRMQELGVSPDSPRQPTA